MIYSNDDLFMAKLTAYREAADQGNAGLLAVLCVIRNGALKYKRSIYSECTFPFRYSSVNCPQRAPDALLQHILGKFPRQGNIAEWGLWQTIESLATGVLSGVTEDITNGSTLYYAASMTTPPSWALDTSKTVFVVQIGAHKFYREL